MVDWDRVEQLRSKGWDWDEIAEDPKVGFQADASSGDPGRALRVLYHRRRQREGKRADDVPKRDRRSLDVTERKWSLLRIAFLIVPLIGVWAAVAYVAPSPVGLILPAIPWLLIALAGAAFVLIYALLRAEKRWSKVLRSTVIGGIVLGLVFTGVVGLAGSLIFGCPYLPPSSTLSAQPAPGWTYGNMAPWQDGGRPVVYFYGASWCPYCSAGSWAIFKALSEFGSVTGTQLGFSSLNDVSPGTPEVILANAVVVSSSVAFQVSEDTSGVESTFPGTSGCFQAAYVGAYSGGAIPFLVVNGRAIHAGSPIISPPSLSAYAYSATNPVGTGAQTVYNQVLNENGTAWGVVQTQAWWIMAYIVKGTGQPVSAFSAKWTSATTQAVTSDLAQIS